MAISTYDSGFGSVGPALLTQEPFVTAGAVIWVDSTTGDDTKAGTKRTAPKATIFGASGAISVATTGASDLIVCEKTHRESISSAYTWSKNGVRLASLGSGTDRAQLTVATAAAVGITMSGTDNQIWGFYFPASTAAATAKISVTGAGNRVRGCAFDAGANDAFDQIIISAAARVRVRDCTFTVTAGPSGTTQTGITVTGASVGCEFDGLTFNGSTFGWTEDAFVIGHADVDQFDINNITLQNGSRITVVTGAKGNISGYTIDDGQAVAWTE